MSCFLNNDLVSFVIPSFNHGRFIKRSIKSVIDQDYQNVELIIIDDGSTDDSIEIIKGMLGECTKRFVRFEFISRNNKGLSATLNEGLKWCKGEYFAPLASDDIALPHRVSFLMNKMTLNPLFEIVGGRSQAIDEFDNLLNRFYGSVGVFGFKELFLFKKFLMLQSSLIKMSSIKNVGLFDEKVRMEDIYMQLRITEKGSDIESFEEVLSYYRRHNFNVSKDYAMMSSERLKLIEFFSNNELYSDAIESVIELNTNDLYRGLYGIDVFDTKSVTKFFSDNNFSVIAYGAGSQFEIIKNILHDFAFSDVCISKNNEIFSTLRNSCLNGQGIDAVLICSTYCSQIFDFLLSKGIQKDKIKIAVF